MQCAYKAALPYQAWPFITFEQLNNKGSKVLRARDTIKLGQELDSSVEDSKVLHICINPKKVDRSKQLGKFMLI